MKITPLRRVQGWGLSTYAGLVGRTARYQMEGQEHVNQVHAAGRPAIIAGWHGMTMMLFGCLTAANPGRYVVVVPDDSRGAVLSLWVRRRGAKPIAVSMKADSLVTARRLLALVRQMKVHADPAGESWTAREGRDLFLLPDGPDGPSHEPKKGVVFIARKTGALIVPTGAFTATGYRIPRWDRYVVPFPFSRIAVVMGEPMEVSTEVDLEQARVAVRERLNQVERAAELLYQTGTTSI